MPTEPQLVRARAIHAYFEGCEGIDTHIHRSVFAFCDSTPAEKVLQKFGPPGIMSESFASFAQLPAAEQTAARLALLHVEACDEMQNRLNSDFISVPHEMMPRRNTVYTSTVYGKCLQVPGSTLNG